MNFKVSCSVSLHVSFILKFVFKTQNLSALTAIFEGFLILSLHDFVAVDEDMFFAQCVLSDIISGGHSNSGQISRLNGHVKLISSYRPIDLLICIIQLTDGMYMRCTALHCLCPSRKILLLIGYCMKVHVCLYPPSPFSFSEMSPTNQWILSPLNL